ncbi:transposase [Haloarcula japonica DSM 6131]|uniref:Transposase n=1 Tax=Haloarcula japonica (strain ATCC 49778 / DSM 6131 / JCM 7785 / NBRC 101032 / NCIMB 13157 / TR-1) TaxID=1227453 RepID=M0LDR6_HALJT|nr:transposase [Haloarcula japonica DSM 6131]
MKITRHPTYNLNYHIVWFPNSGGIEDSADLAD